MNLATLGLEKGAPHTLDMAAACSAGGGLVVKLPDAAQKGNGFAQLGELPKALRFDFIYDPDVKGGQIGLVISKDVVATGATITLRDFKLSSGRKP